MSAKYKKERGARPDKNQPDIVKDLRKLGAIVETGHDDILIEYQGRLYWIEIKESSPFTLKGKLRKGFLRDNQIRLLKKQLTRYAVCWTFAQCFDFIRDIDGDYLTPAKYKGLLIFKHWDDQKI